MSTPPLDTIDEVADGVDADADADADADMTAGVDRDVECPEDSERPGSSSSNDSSGDSPNTILVAAIERRPFSLSPVQVRFNGTEGPASKLLQRERPFSRCAFLLTWPSGRKTLKKP